MFSIRFLTVRVPIERWAKRDKFTLFFCSGAFFVIAVVILSLWLTRPQITNEQDLNFAKGQLSEHYIDQGGRSGHQIFYCAFRLKDYTSTFNIKRENLKYFDVRGFVNLIDGDSVTIGTARVDSNRLNSGISPVYLLF